MATARDAFVIVALAGVIGWSVNEILEPKKPYVKPARTMGGVAEPVINAQNTPAERLRAIELEPVKEVLPATVEGKVCMNNAQEQTAVRYSVDVDTIRMIAEEYEQSRFTLTRQVGNGAIKVNKIRGLENCAERAATRNNPGGVCVSEINPAISFTLACAKEESMSAEVKCDVAAYRNSEVRNPSEECSAQPI